MDKQKENKISNICSGGGRILSWKNYWDDKLYWKPGLFRVYI